MAALAVAAPPGAAAAASTTLPLGPRRLAETRATQPVAPGVTLTRIARGQPSAGDVHTVSAGFTASRRAARGMARRLTAAGFPARVTRITRRAPDDPRRGPLGYVVRTGTFATQPEATAHRDRVAAAGFPAARIDFTGEDGAATTGPWALQVLTVDPRAFTGTIAPALATDVVPGRETLTAMSARFGALAGVNGGSFVVADADGTEGDLAGISVIGGVPVSEAVNGRTSLLLPRGNGAGAQIQALWTREALRSSDGATRDLDGLNRAPGLIRACGGAGGDRPTQLPKHDFTCADRSEVIRYTSLFGATTPAGPGVEAVLDARGRVTELRGARGGPVPAGGAVLAGTAGGARWLRAHARSGMRIRTEIRLLGERGKVRLRASLGVVSGGPRLLRAGRADMTAFTEGFVWRESAEVFWRFGVRRNPRTIAGITRDGRLLLVTADGHAPGYSLGLSFWEEAAVMRALGAVDAVNLDGGGSTTMALGATLVNRPSDATGERPIGDAILLRP